MDRARMLSWVKPGLTVLNAVSLCTIAISAAIYIANIHRPDSGRPQAAARHVDPASNPRLPRARPDEPITTASIRSAPERAATKVESPRLELPAEPPSDLLQAYIGEHAAIRTCEDKVRNGLALPGSLNRILATTGVYRGAGDGTVVTFDFDALNGLGFPLKMQVECVLNHSRIARLEVLPRYPAR